MTLRGIIGTAAAMVMAGALALPALAQSGPSEGYKFLKAVDERDGAVVTELLEQPGNVLVNARDVTNGRTAMHIVVARRDLAWINFLRQKGANPDIPDKKGVTPLMIASNLGFVEGVEALAKAGARVDQSNDAGETPLISAIHRRDVGMVRVLLEHGANPDRNDNSGRSGRDYAELMVGGKAIIEAIASADEKRAGKTAEQSYGPSF